MNNDGHGVSRIKEAGMPGQKAAKDSRRAQIMRAAYHVASRVGLDGLTVRLVATKARMSSGLVHFYFKSKERLLAALLTDVLKASPVLYFKRDVAWIRSPLARLWSLIRREIIRLTSEPRRARLFFEYCVKGLRQPLFRTRMRAEFRRYREAFQPTAEAVLASEPERFPKVSAEGLAAVAVGVIEGCAVQSVIDPVNFDVDEYMTAAKGLLEQPVTTKTALP
jgi:TetR/AcrR family transcriptional regulator, transcriptional repressor of bet genes